MDYLKIVCTSCIVSEQATKMPLTFVTIKFSTKIAQYTQIVVLRKKART